VSTRGFAMIEVLVALFLAAVGLYAGLWLALGGLASTAEARRADIAAVLAADLAGRIRALAAVDWTALPDPIPCGSGCSPIQLAAIELADWLAAVETSLPGGTADLAPGGDASLALSLSWTETGGAPRELRLEIAQ
jgi:type IV pilus assembly protein PilV